MEKESDVQSTAGSTPEEGAVMAEESLDAFDGDEERFEVERNRLGGVLLLKGKDNISSSNELYAQKLKSYANTLYWNETLREDAYHSKLDFRDFAKEQQLAFKPLDRFGPDAALPSTKSRPLARSMEPVPVRTSVAAATFRLPVFGARAPVPVSGRTVAVFALLKSAPDVNRYDHDKVFCNAPVVAGVKKPSLMLVLMDTLPAARVVNIPGSPL